MRIIGEVEGAERCALEEVWVNSANGVYHLRDLPSALALFGFGYEGTTSMIFHNPFAPILLKDWIKHAIFMSRVPHTPDDRHLVKCQASHESNES
jgi:hypothetical protein